MWTRVCLYFLLVGLSRAQDVTPRLEQIIQSYVSDHKFMGSVLIARGETLILSRGYGSANLEWDIPNTPTTKFRLGSITKQFTAACVLLLEERGKWKISDPVKKYMPDAPAAWDKITIFHLLTHTSGIPSFTGFSDYRDSEAKATTPAELVKRFRDKPLEFEPGTKWNYSNSGYVLLGYLLEKVSGQSYQEFVQQNIFTPLGMKDSGYDSNTAIIYHRASGYTPSKNGIENAGYINMTIPLSAGALYSTTEDLLKWERRLFGGKLLSQASLQEMTTSFKQNYAFGLLVSNSNGRKKIDHNGGIEGFNTALAYWPEDQLTVVVLGNLNGNAPDQIAAQLAATIHGEKVTLSSERKEITLPPDVLANYVGTYELAPAVDLQIMLEGNHLETQLTGQPKFSIFAETPTLFFLKVVDAQLEFAKDASGKVTQVTLHQGGHDVACKKK
jgi:CubicO group peptidase (beta-lactamase class C family)